MITDVNVATPTVGPNVRGAHVNPADARSIHMLLCEGVAEFKVQGWYDAQQRWVPEVDPDGDGPDADDSDFFDLPGSPSVQVPGVLYPWRNLPGIVYGGVSINNMGYPSNQVNEANFNRIPGLGRALKFTFTLFDSKGIIEKGRTFTHIVYLDK